ncbi:MAG: serine acetyltransferase [Paludibacter sp.]|jgi:serine O-acetyltransferase|nr:serine acetyltransferase [Paludibacter sp.]
MNKELLDSIKKLSHVESFKNVCSEHGQNDAMPSTTVLQEIVQLARSILFPGYFGDSAVNTHTMLYHIGVNVDRLQMLLTQQIRAGMCFNSRNESLDCNGFDELSKEKSTAFIIQLPEIREKLHTDVIAAYNGDPAAKSFGEVIFCYPSIRAISNYRIANALLHLGVPLIPRIITEMAHSETGIDIHPGATIGSYFTIDHGTGVVIGETAIIGNNVKMYQGVTLGAKSFPLDENGNPIKGISRHPRIGNNVIIYSNSTILGTVTIGDGAIIGGNLWVDTDVPAGAKLAQKRLKSQKAEE